MKRAMLILLSGLVLLSFSGIASAYTWSDYDDVGYYVGSDDADYYYGLSIAVADGFRPGLDSVTSAKLWFYLADDSSSDNHEYAYVWSTGKSAWVYAGEVDSNSTFGPFSVAGGGISELNSLGSITVAVYPYPGGDFNWKGAKVEAYGSQAVPEPATMLLLGLGLVGLAGFGRKKFNS